MIREVIQQNDPKLRAENEEISFSNEELQNLINDMFNTMENANLSGLAAPQIAVNKKVFACENFRKIFKDETDQSVIEKYIFINPQIVSCSEATEDFYEGCGSVQNGEVFGLVNRPKRVTIEAFNKKGEPVRLKADGFLARVIQHEFDHLNGILFIDKLVEGTKLISKEEYIRVRQEEIETKKADKTA